MVSEYGHMLYKIIALMTGYNGQFILAGFSGALSGCRGTIHPVSAGQILGYLFASSVIFLGKAHGNGDANTKQKDAQEFSIKACS